MTLTKMPCENIVGKGENAGNQHLLLFPECFQARLPKEIFISMLFLFCHLQKLSIWTSLKFCHLHEKVKMQVFSNDYPSFECSNSGLCGKKLNIKDFPRNKYVHVSTSLSETSAPLVTSSSLSSSGPLSNGGGFPLNASVKIAPIFLCLVLFFRLEVNILLQDISLVAPERKTHRSA